MLKIMTDEQRKCIHFMITKRMEQTGETFIAARDNMMKEIQRITENETSHFEN